MSLRSPGLYLASAGGYPRFGETHELLVLRRTMDALANGDRTSADLLDAQNDMTRRAIADQVHAGLDIITDGQIRWNDPISHIPAKLDNVRIDELLPFLIPAPTFASRSSPRRYSAGASSSPTNTASRATLSVTCQRRRRKPESLRSSRYSPALIHWQNTRSRKMATALAARATLPSISRIALATSRKY